MLILGLVKKAIFSLGSKQDKKEVNQLHTYVPPPSPPNMVSLLWLVVSIYYLDTELMVYLRTRNLQNS